MSAHDGSAKMKQRSGHFSSLVSVVSIVPVVLKAVKKISASPFQRGVKKLPLLSWCILMSFRATARNLVFVFEDEMLRWRSA
jgi:hypothetical protein